MAEKLSPYRQFSQGQDLPFTLHTLNPGGSVCSQDTQITIAFIRGGGFFGEVIIDETLVAKTSVPDPWHDLWRRINWNFRDFPSQVNQTQARLDYLATNLIADVLPIVTNGRFIAPHCLGYTKLSNGYAQVVARMHGRPPRYDTPADEFSEFRLAQREIRETGYHLGLEQAAQIHEDNPFGMANLWKDPENNRWIWLDTLPAIPHKGWVWPFFYFRFHKEVRNWFYPPESGPQQITFNRIHTDTFRDYISRERHKFSDELYERVMENIKLYDELWQEKQSQPNPSRNFRGAALALAGVLGEQIPKPLHWIINAFTGPIKIILNPNIVALDGIEQAFNHGVLSRDELDQAKASLSPDISAARTMAILYEGHGWFLSKPGALLAYASILELDVDRVKQSNILELISYAMSELQDINKAAAVVAIGVGFWAYGALLRRTGTNFIGHYYGIDTTRARFLSLLPFVGDYSAIVAQVAASSSNSGKEIWHYFMRNLVARVSSIFPDGGWGSEREGGLWKWCQRENLKSLFRHLVNSSFF